MKITCDVIKDLAELYVGEALSEDSKLLVEEHILNCKKCRAYVETARDAFEGVAELNFEEIVDEKVSIKRLRDMIIRKVLPVVVATVVVLSLTFISIYYALFVHEITIPYDGEAVYVTEDGILHYPGRYGFSTFYDTSGKYARVQVYTHHIENIIDEIRGVESEEEKFIDLKEVIPNKPGSQVIYRDGLDQQVIWIN